MNFKIIFIGNVFAVALAVAASRPAFVGSSVRA
jgi:hypothetical protein